MGATVYLNFRVTQWLPKKDGRGILKGKYSPSLPFWASLRQRKLDSFHILVYGSGFPLERFFAHFLCDKESGGRAA